MITMATTIQIEETTLQMLKEIKERTKLKTYDDVIKEFIKSKISAPESMFGKYPRMKKFTRKERADFHEV